EFERELPALRDLLSRLSAPGGVYFAMGDTDQHPDRVPRMIEGTRVEPLVNRIVRVGVGDRLFSIGGVELDYTSTGARATVHQLDEASGAGDIRILVAHRPDVALGLRPSSRIDLTVAGHTHGGQVALPIVGPLMAFTDVPLAVAAGGLHDLGDARRIYVSRGIGMERGQAPRVRLNVPPEISLLTLR
nr:phosphohydrolase [Actinomycetota bacterium]